jgi:hypothetical protein
MRLNVRKHSKNVQSRTEIIYVEESTGQWFLSLKAPDPSLALYLTWNKMQMAMPASFVSRMKDEVQRLANDGEGMTQREKFMEKAKMLKKAKSQG